MKVYGAGPLPWVLVGALLLAGCGGEGAAPEPSERARLAVDSAQAPPDIPLVGEEHRILAFGDSLFTGYGLKPGEGYPERLEGALRAKGINARIANAGLSGAARVAANSLLRMRARPRRSASASSTRSSRLRAPCSRGERACLVSRLGRRAAASAASILMQPRRAGRRGGA